MKQSAAILVTGFAGILAAGAVASIPPGMLEWAATSIGLSELIPAAAPPLGATFRLLLSGAAMVIAMAVVAVLLPPVKADITHTRKAGNAPMSFGFAKLTDFARGRRRDEDASDLPVLRRADAHPDAPARAPLFVSRDLGEELGRSLPQPAMEIPAPEMPVQQMPAPAAPTLAMPVEIAVPPVIHAEIEPIPDVSTEIEPLVMPRSPEPMHWEEIKREMTRAPRLVASGETAESIANLSIGELAARLEAGLRRRTQGDAQPDQPGLQASSPVSLAASSDQPRRTVEPDIDAALQAALATLRGITARAG